MSTQQHIKFYIETLGCSKNQVDSESMLASVEQYEYSFTKESAEADFIIINTCGFIKSAKEQSIQTFLDFREAYPDKKIIIAGCFAQRYFETIRELFPEADGYYGSQAPSQIGSIVAEVLSGDKPALKKDDVITQLERKTTFNFKGSVYVKVAEGCNNNCNFCAIPIIRGQIKSRTLDDVYNEIVSLIDKGYFEINLIAQDLAAWGEDLGEKTLITLLNKLSLLSGKFWIRLLYIHPDKFPMQLLDVCKRDSRILPYFDIPFQHASETVLKKMGRKGSYKKHLDLVKKIRHELPDSIIRSTIMLGHPGEGRKEFIEVVSFLEEAQLDWVGFFVYSREEDTKSFNMRGSLLDKLSKRVAEKRKRVLEDIQSQITPKKLLQWIGQTVDVLIEEDVKEENLFIGRSSIDAPEVDGLVVIKGSGLKEGDVIKAKILSVASVDLIAEVVE
ncbi:30S ribosomal protein S12 methylthiotransferase RimO [Thiospirochaeta perfilievii]|uniref:30S ribosomal protein S12 methylthiotransferase RimO n=1 Tax=Thiospirochaeta perfilievii TaxID=252967 RepID=UPI001658E12E|nr:30S ribosomal protein S12 methylthiotransferase RimO [Thiospirochaeta perfilievii]